MPLTAGTVLGRYEILAPLGAGGMGEVYRARDPKLARVVALKVLPTSFAADADQLRRFEQEARAAGALNHPHIVAIHDVGAYDGAPYVVSELLEGETLRERLSLGPFPTRKALEYGSQIAEGLAAAHEKGIVHRDLKPQNLFLTREGRVKILDFGLAKVSAPGPLGPETVDLKGTVPGAVLGTVGYMSPEQLRGKPVDHRADIFSFGAVLYEMISGQRAFGAGAPADVISAILREDPAPLPARRASPAVVRLVQHCLEKDPEQRYQSTRDLVFDLAALSSSAGGEEGVRAALPRFAWRRLRAVGLFAAGALCGAALAAWLGRGEGGSTPSFHHLTYSGQDTAPALSPDGRTLAFVSERDGRARVWLKQLPDGGEVALTTGPDFVPRFSPDGTQVLFARTEDDRSVLYRMPVLGGEERKLVEGALEGDWSPDGRRLVFLNFEDARGRTVTTLGIAGSDGGAARTLVRVDGFGGLVHPRWSPDGRWIAVTPAPNAQLSGGAPPSIVLVSPEDGTQRTIPAASPVGDVSSVAWLGPREIVYSQATSVVLPAGSTARIFRQAISTGAVQGSAWSPSNSLVLDAGPERFVFEARSSRGNLREMALAGGAAPRWLTRGSSTDRQPAYSPDAERLVFSSNRSGNLDVWLLAVRNGSLRRLTDDPGSDWDPAFTPDGRIVWSSNRTGHFECWIAEADGSGARPLTSDGVDAENPVPTPDGRFVVYASSNPAKAGLWQVPREGGEAARLVEGAALLPDVSPDGRHVLYQVNVGANEVAVRVARIAEAGPLPFEIRIARRKTTTTSLGRARFLPGGRSIAFVGQDEHGVSGVFAQDFEPGRDTSRTRRPLVALEPDVTVESFALSADGRRLTVAGLEQLFSIMTAENLLGLSPTGR